MESVVRNAGRQELITDWYIPEKDPSQGWVYPGPTHIANDPELIMIANSLAEQSEECNSEEFVVKEERHDGTKRIYRGHRIETIDGRLFSLRKIPSFVPDFHMLGIPVGIQKMLMSPRLSNGGLIIISGETGQGKSTTSASFLLARIKEFGSFCLTLENPPELPLHGVVGEGDRMGICIQTDVRAGHFGEALRGAVRCYPTQGNSILFVGEVRDPETAAEALRIAINGHLVVTSIHGGDVISSLRRLMSLAMSYQGMGDMEARNVLSTAFRMIIHQKLRDNGSANGGKKLEAQVLFSPNQTSPVANRIREGKIEGLATEIQQQETLLKSGQIAKLMSLWDPPSD